MQRSCADVNPLINGSAELAQGALYLIHYSDQIRGDWQPCLKRGSTAAGGAVLRAHGAAVAQQLGHCGTRLITAAAPKHQAHYSCCS